MLQPSVSAGGPLLRRRMLPSPVTSSTPFSVKDILKMEQQLALHPQHAQHAHALQQQLPQHFHSHALLPPACALGGGGGDSPGFSDGEERMSVSYLNTLSEHESLLDSSLSPDLYGAPTLGHHHTTEENKLDTEGTREQASEFTGDFLKFL